ncbi:hypothetical protein KIPB_003681, partial [Kipferlia bialata]
SSISSEGIKVKTTCLDEISVLKQEVADNKHALTSMSDTEAGLRLHIESTRGYTDDRVQSVQTMAEACVTRTDELKGQLNALSQRHSQLVDGMTASIGSGVLASLQQHNIRDVTPLLAAMDERIGQAEHRISGNADTLTDTPWREGERRNAQEIEDTRRELRSSRQETERLRGLVEGMEKLMVNVVERQNAQDTVIETQRDLIKGLEQREREREAESESMRLVAIEAERERERERERMLEEQDNHNRVLFARVASLEADLADRQDASTANMERVNRLLAQEREERVRTADRTTRDIRELRETTGRQGERVNSLGDRVRGSEAKSSGLKRLLQREEARMARTAEDMSATERLVAELSPGVEGRALSSGKMRREQRARERAVTPPLRPRSKMMADARLPLSLTLTDTPELRSQRERDSLRGRDMGSETQRLRELRSPNQIVIKELQRTMNELDSSMRQRRPISPLSPSPEPIRGPTPISSERPSGRSTRGSSARASSARPPKKGDREKRRTIKKASTRRR